MKKILYLVTEDSYFCSHRLELAAFIKQQGYEVAVATKCSINNNKYQQLIIQHQLKLFELKFFNRTSFINLFKELLAIYELYNIYKEFKPDIVHHIALKPIIYGTIAATLTKTNKIINAFAGLGFIFTDNNYINFKLKLKKYFFKNIFINILKFICNNKNNKILLLQNKDDLRSLTEIININKINLQTKIIPGSGIITKQYLKVNRLDFTNNYNNTNIKIALVARLLWTKGIAEFVRASEYIQNYIKTHNLAIKPEFIIYGDIDFKNPAFIDYATINNWQNQGLITWKKFCNNIIEAYANCHIAVLPSYREGLPKSLLEAALCARAIVTTNVPGCKEIVEDGINGYLVPKEDSLALANSLLKLMQNQDLMVNMGIAGRKKICNEFSADIIFPKMLELYN
jgi:glycosyltransferase involved in cell wall biosynthesis